MDVAPVGVMIPILAITMGISLGFFGVWTQHKQKLAKLDLEARKGAATDSGQSARIETLEDRVAVLERIITDGGYTVAAQIEALRDARQDGGVELKLGRQAERHG